MQSRITFTPARFDAVYKAMINVHAAVEASGLEISLLHLIRMRVSQINGCGYCLDMHSKEARSAGESEQRLYLLQVWREAPLYSERERAALAWAEAVTRLGAHGVPDEVYSRAAGSFDEQELAALTLAVIEINGWNRLAIAFNKVPGSYQVARSTHQETA